MKSIKQISAAVCAVLIFAAFSGCVSSSPKTSAPAEGTYYPSIKPGKTYTDAVNDLLNPAIGLNCRIDNNNITFLKSDGAVVSSFPLAALMNKTIMAEGGVLSRIVLQGLVTITLYNREHIKTTADAFYFIQQDLKDYRDRLDKKLKDFEPIAAKYRALTVKPQVSEEQRRLIVQANALAQEKKYFDARAKYLEVTKLDNVSYPSAYFNLALLEAQMNLHFAAIPYMKMYLLLAPDAKDARSAQDKIYEWELKSPSFMQEAATKIITDPEGAFVELNVSDSGKPWTYLSRTPADAKFWRDNAKYKNCLIRVSKPGYRAKEVSVPFETLTAETRIQLEKEGTGEDSYGYLGVAFHILTADETRNSGTDSGAMVESVQKNSPAEKADIKAGDIILSFNGKEIKNSVDIPFITAETPIGKEAEIKILRQGKQISVKAVVTKRPN